MALVKIKGDTARRYRDTETGDIVSRHIAEIKPRLQELGWDNAHQRAEYRKTDQYLRFQDYAKGKMKEDTLEQRFNEIRKEDFNKSPNGIFSQFLVDLGVREPDATYSVGESPPKRR
jgi:hypothetical protein